MGGVLMSVFAFAFLAGGVIMYGALILFEDEFIHIVAISFSALILTELVMVALTIRTWHRLMVLAEIFSLLLYLVSLVVFHEYFGEWWIFGAVVFYISENVTQLPVNWVLIIVCLFFIFSCSLFVDWEFIWSYDFAWKVSIITAVSCLPLYFVKFLRKKCSPPSYSKLS